MGDTADSHDWVIGCAIQVQTKHTKEDISGTVFGYDPNTDMVMIKEPGTHGGVVNLRLYKAAQLQVLHAERPKQQQLQENKLPYVDKDRARQREEKALQQAEADMAKVGVGVTKEAQQLFDVLCRTMPCTWHGRSICVMEAVEIEPPYLVESIRSIAGENNVFERVRKVLPAIRNQMGLS
eukprot:GHUV01003996.1.p1 GENE.GHUV01003996.1~~GHUV01003996.1.p1  ORF type:complete len:180 (+),score=44.74 GHUV01003996.1:322-861(+)